MAFNFDPATCPESQASFNLVFTIAAALLHVMSCPLEYLQDRFGTWIFRSAMTILNTCGLLLLALSTPSLSDLLYPAYTLLGISGIGLSIANIQTANLAKGYCGLIITIMSGLVITATLLFFLVKQGYEAGIDLSTTISIMTSLIALQWVRTFFSDAAKTNSISP